MSNEYHSLGTPLGGGYMADSKPAIPEQLAWNEEHRKPGNTISGPSVGSKTRRLSASKKQMAPARLKAALKNLIDSVPGMEDAGSDINVVPSKLAVSWPVFFEPKMLACGPLGAVAAITARGFGAAAKRQGGDATTFRLGGLGQMLPLVAAHWGSLHTVDREGLLLVTRHGRLAVCPGQPRESWVCSRLSTAPQLPLADGVRLASAAAAWLLDADSEPKLHAAFVEESSPNLASVFTLDGTGDDASWLPMGEIALPRRAKHVSLAFVNGELLVSTDAGHVIRRRMQDGAVTDTASHAIVDLQSDSEVSWKAACGLQGEDGVAHLQLRREAGAHSWRPELLMGQAQPVILQ